MIKYKENAKTHNIIVQLDGKTVGEIRKVADGFQYFPKGQTVGGQVWSTVGECKCDIEGD